MKLSNDQFHELRVSIVETNGSRQSENPVPLKVSSGSGNITNNVNPKAIRTGVTRRSTDIFDVDE
jgi:hypothetical protein